MQTFKLIRDTDVSGVSGVGIVAEGAQFTSGKVVMAWLGEHHTVELFDHIEEVEEIHGHHGLTRVVWDAGQCGRCRATKIMSPVCFGCGTLHD